MARDIDVGSPTTSRTGPNGRRTGTDNARLGPLHDGKSMYLTATAYQRLQRDYPVPEALKVPLPTPGETPNRITYAAR